VPRKRMGDVVVMLPGITGSVLQKDGKDVWAPTPGAVVGALFSLGKNVKSLALKEDPPDVDDLGDGVVATKVMADIHLIPGLWTIDGYSKLKSYVLKTFDVRLGENLFEFPYDWRRDNRASARKLQKEASDWLHSWRQKSGNDDAKLILVGHSMGGLVSRYYLECLGGWRDTRTLVTFGTPYRGSLKAVGTLANGFAKKIGPLSLDLSEMVRSLTAVYQLLPIYPCYDAGDGKLVRVAETDVPNIDRTRAAAAREFHEEISRAVEANEQDDEYRRDRYGIRPVIGTFQPTAQSAKTSGGGVELIRTYEGADQDGDGTVPRVSATPIEVEHEENAMFAAQRHASLQNDDPVLAQLAGILSGLRLDLSVFRGPSLNVSLDVDDLYEVGEPITVRARPERETDEPMLAVVENAARPPDDERPDEVARATLREADDGWHSAEVPPLPEGTYRVTVFGSGMVEPVTDVVVVMSGESAH
jgi:pimeloyl-ACP methyl ester carboxylesterase